MTEDWIPHMPVTPEDSEVFASQFTLDNTRSEDFKKEEARKLGRCKIPSENYSLQVVADGQQGWRGQGY